MDITQEELQEFEKIRQEGLTLRNSRFFSGLRSHLTELYPEEAHFIYELLQNAEDTKATQVSFLLRKGELIFIHNGKRKFNLEDISSITNIGNSSKVGDDTTVGKFGIGFKSVYAYTDTPIIHSGKWDFKITDMVIPELKLSEVEEYFKDYTYFKIPFNQSEKNPEKAYEEILKGLKGLKLETVLFLDNIDEISWACDEDDVRHMIRKTYNSDGYKIKIECEQNSIEYLKFSSVAKITTETEDVKNVKIDLAYQLKRKPGTELFNEDDYDLSEMYEIVPAETKNKVYIDFPAERETPELNFLINSRFACAVSRATIKKCDENDALFKELVNLQKESIIYLKEEGFLTVDFLGVLPNSKDQLGERYQIFFDEIKDFFILNEVIPTKSGDYRKASDLLQGGADIEELLTDDEACLIVNLGNKLYWKNRFLPYSEPSFGAGDDVNKEWTSPVWVKNALINTRPSDFIEDLGIEKWNFDKFFYMLKKCSNSDVNALCKKILLEKKDPDFRKIYIKSFSLGGDIQNIKYAPIFKLANGDVVPSLEVYYENPEMRSEDIYFSKKFIKKDIYEKTSPQQKNQIMGFFKQMGIEMYSAKASCRELLKKYTSIQQLTSKDIPIKQHIKDLKNILKVCHDNSDFKLELKNIPLIYTNNDCYRCVKDISIKPEYQILNVVTGKYQLYTHYRESLSDEEWNFFIDLLKQLGSFYELKIITKIIDRKKIIRLANEGSYPKGERDTRICEEFDIEYLDNIVENTEILKSASKFIWNVLIKENDKKRLFARYQANRSAKMFSGEAKFIETLKNKAWIMDKNGQLRIPREISLNDLPFDWIKPANYMTHPVLEAIKFAELVKISEEEYKEIEQKCRDIGFKNSEQTNLLLEFASILEEDGISLQDYVQKVKCERVSNFSKPSSNNIERREEKNLEAYETSSKQEYEQRLRSVATNDQSKTRNAAHNYLKNTYEEDGKVCCQLCGKLMPFKDTNGDDYFETVQIFNNMKVNFSKQYLALCPNCAAEYDIWVRKQKKQEDDLREKIKQRIPQRGETEVLIDFEIHDTRKTLRFVGTHFIDIRTSFLSNEEIKKEEELRRQAEVKITVDKVLWLPCSSSIPLNIGDTVKNKKNEEGQVVGEDGKYFVVKFSNRTSEVLCSKDWLEKKIIK